MSTATLKERVSLNDFPSLVVNHVPDTEEAEILAEFHYSNWASNRDQIESREALEEYQNQLMHLYTYG